MRSGEGSEDMSDSKQGVFTESFAENYDRYLVPMQFDPSTPGYSLTGQRLLRRPASWKPRRARAS